MLGAGRRERRRQLAEHPGDAEREEGGPRAPKTRRRAARKPPASRGASARVAAAAPPTSACRLAVRARGVRRAVDVGGDERERRHGRSSRGRRARARARRRPQQRRAVGPRRAPPRTLPSPCSCATRSAAAAARRRAEEEAAQLTAEAPTASGGSAGRASAADATNGPASAVDSPWAKRSRSSRSSVGRPSADIRRSRAAAPRRARHQARTREQLIATSATAARRGRAPAVAAEHGERRAAAADAGRGRRRVRGSSGSHAASAKPAATRALWTPRRPWAWRRRGTP